MGDLNELLKNAQPIVKDHDTSNKGTYEFMSAGGGKCRLQVPAQDLVARWSFYQVQANNPLPYQVPWRGISERAYLPLRTVVQLLVVDDNNNQVTEFKSPLELSVLVTSFDISIARILDLFLPETGYGVLTDSAANLAAYIRTELHSDTSALGALLHESVSRWDEFFSHREWWDDSKDRLNWLSHNFDILVGSDELAPPDKPDFNSGNWQAAEKKEPDFWNANEFDATQRGFVLSVSISRLVALDPVICAKRDSVR